MSRVTVCGSKLSRVVTGIGRVILTMAVAAALTSCAGALGQASEVSIVGEAHAVISESAADRRPLNLGLWEKRRAEVPVSVYAESGKVVLLVHGATIPGRVLFDLQVPRRTGPTYSLMDYLAGQGFDVFAIDIQNYGHSDRHWCGRCVTAQVAADDINAAVDYIARLRKVDRINLLGHSWGATTGGLFAMQHPRKVRRLVLSGLPLSPSSEAMPTSEFGTLTEEFLRSGFNPRVGEITMMDAFVHEALKHASVPNGVWMEHTSPLDPRRIAVPVMIIMGSEDRATPITQPELPGFFRDLATVDKQFIIVPGAGHGHHLHRARARAQQELAKWIGFP
jgi:pimeloyl-ACP methyl ester carboxylesterase